VPEGDTIARAARRLHAALAGRTVARFETPLASLMSLPVPGPVAGRRVERVEPRGKHLLVILSGDLILHTHMRMHGSWHVYAPGERWRQPRSQMRLLMETDLAHAVGFRVPVAEWLTAGSLARHAVLRALGPDLLVPVFDAEGVVARMRQAGDLPLADVLLDQRVMAGVGNVIKSEVLFAARLHPFDPVAACAGTELRALVGVARRLLAINAADRPGSSGRRTTGRLHPDEQLWVYGRTGKPCFRCGASIEMRRTGPDARATYWCRRCQPPRAPSPEGAAVDPDALPRS
jgi:endonuclease-8